MRDGRKRNRDICRHSLSTDYGETGFLAGYCIISYALIILDCTA